MSMNEIAKPYPPPVDRLLTLGEPRRNDSGADYTVIGMGHEHVPELIRMATDEALNSAPSDSARVWAPVHAWRALAQLRAPEAIVPLLGLLSRISAENDDWVGEDVPKALAAIGPASLDPVAAYLADPSNDEWARVSAASALGYLGQSHPETREACVARLTAELARYAEQSESFNAFLILPLLDLGAVESASVIKAAYEADCVDEFVEGDWEDVAIRLGLQTHRAQPRRPHSLRFFREQLQAPLDDEDVFDDELVRDDEPVHFEVAEPRAPIRSGPKIGRNDPCPCGSGKKFKKCCGP